MAAMAAINSHRDLVAWQRGMDLVVRVYGLTKNWPRDELYGLTAQARRAAVSVPANIAEGYGRSGRASYIYFLKVAQGSLKELETHIEIAERIGFVTTDQCRELLAEAVTVGKLLNGLIRSLSEPKA